MTSCCNCGTTKDVHPYSFDLDLPTIHACQMCLMAISLGDEEMLADLKPRKRKRARQGDAAVKSGVE